MGGKDGPLQRVGLPEWMKWKLVFFIVFLFVFSADNRALQLCTDRAVLVREEGPKTPAPPPTAHTAWSSGAPMGAICSLSQYN